MRFAASPMETSVTEIAGGWESPTPTPTARVAPLQHLSPSGSSVYESVRATSASAATLTPLEQLQAPLKQQEDGELSQLQVRSSC